jgi:hypothetical protein
MPAVCLCTERLGVQRAGPVCFYEVLAPYYYQVTPLNMPPAPEWISAAQLTEFQRLSCVVVTRHSTTPARVACTVGRAGPNALFWVGLQACAQAFLNSACQRLRSISYLCD